jgi:hypothetical protein
VEDDEAAGGFLSVGVRVASSGCAVGVTSIQAVSSHAGLPLPSDPLDRWRSGHTATVWARAHFFDGGGLEADEPVVLDQVAWRAEVELAGDQAAYG